MNWRESLSVAQRHGVPCLAMAASLAYFDSYRTANLPQNLEMLQPHDEVKFVLADRRDFDWSLDFVRAADLGHLKPRIGRYRPLMPR